MKTVTLSEKKQPLFPDYCQFLLASFHNFTQTYFAEHTEKWSHDQLNRLLSKERIPARKLWESVKVSDMGISEACGTSSGSNDLPNQRKFTTRLHATTT